MEGLEMEFVIKPKIVKPLPNEHQINKGLYNRISRVKADGSPFFEQIDKMKNCSDTWWPSPGYKENLLKLMQLLADPEKSTIEKTMLVPHSGEEIKAAIEHRWLAYRINLNVGIEKETDLVVSKLSKNGIRLKEEENALKLPFSPLLAAIIRLSTNLVEPSYSQGVTVQMGETNGGSPLEVMAQVSGLRLREGAGMFRPVFEKILGEMGGTVKINGVITFKAPIIR
jgi:hypothetical protein